VFAAAAFCLGRPRLRFGRELDLVNCQIKCLADWFPINTYWVSVVSLSRMLNRRDCRRG
jgi:hypothetical protein